MLLRLTKGQLVEMLKGHILHGTWCNTCRKHFHPGVDHAVDNVLKSYEIFIED